MTRSHAHRLPLLVLAATLEAGTVQGPVQIHEKDGRLRASLRDCVAILEPVEAAVPVAGPSRSVSIRTVGKQFLPRVSIATPGTEVAFPNLDHILHNVFSVSPGNRFDTAQYQPGDAPKVKVVNPGLVKLYCNVHHQMNAFIWVVETPFAQLLEKRAGVEFSQVPPGNYRLRLWHPEAGEKTWTVKIEGQETSGAWTLEASLPALEVHKNKFGKDYPPPSDETGY